MKVVNEVWGIWHNNKLTALYSEKEAGLEALLEEMSQDEMARWRCTKPPYTWESESIALVLREHKISNEFTRPGTKPAIIPADEFGGDF